MWKNIHDISHLLSEFIQVYIFGAFMILVEIIIHSVIIKKLSIPRNSISIFMKSINILSYILCTKVEKFYSNSNWKQQYIYCIIMVIVGWSVYMKRMYFTKSEVEGEIYAMKEKISTNKILASTSLVFGILSLFSFVLYFYSANHAPYTYIDVIFLGPFFSFVGIVISIITRKSRKIYL